MSAFGKHQEARFVYNDLEEFYDDVFAAYELCRIYIEWRGGKVAQLEFGRLHSEFADYDAKEAFRAAHEHFKTSAEVAALQSHTVQVRQENGAVETNLAAFAAQENFENLLQKIPVFRAHPGSAQLGMSFEACEKYMQDVKAYFNLKTLRAKLAKPWSNSPSLVGEQAENKLPFSTATKHAVLGSARGMGWCF